MPAGAKIAVKEVRAGGEFPSLLVRKFGWPRTISAAGPDVAFGTEDAGIEAKDAIVSGIGDPKIPGRVKGERRLKEGVE